MQKIITYLALLDQKYVNKTEKNNSVTIYKNAGLKPEVYIVISLLAFLTFVAAVASITKYRKKYYRLDESSMGTVNKVLKTNF